MPKIRITGIVRAMNRARERLSAGIPETEADDFRFWLKDTVTGIETICREHRATPEDLPAPSRRAYHYLKSIDLENIPTREAGAPPSAKRVRIKNLVAITNRLHAQMGAIAKWPRPPKSNYNKTTASLLAEIQQHTTRVEEICRDSNTRPADLPAPSRRAYQWLKFLSESENLHTHLKALSIITREARQAKCRKSLPAKHRKIPVYILFYNVPHLYRYQEREDGIHLTAHEALIHAPRPILKALICAALLGKETPHARRVNQFTVTEEFAEYALALEATTLPVETSTRGRHYDLKTIFQRLNAQYFEGQLPRPRLTWNNTITYRKMGHYQPATDTILISLTLDSPGIPAYVIEFVLYHEMLHKKVGIQKINGRRYAHTPTFRAAERQFERHAEAQAFLNQLGQKISSPFPQ